MVTEMELMDTEKELNNLSHYIYHTTSNFNDSRRLYDLKRSKYDVIFKPNPPFLALVANTAPRLLNLLTTEHYFEPSSTKYWIVSIYINIYIILFLFITYTYVT